MLRRSIVQSTLLTSLYLIITLIGQGCDGAASFTNGFQKSVNSSASKPSPVISPGPVSSSTPHPQAIFSPSTTIHAETENNTSQSALFTDEYYNYITTEVGATNGDTPNQHISKLPISTLLTGEAANTKIYVETQSWFCHSTSNEVSGPSGTTLKAGPSHCGSHNDIGHNSGDMSVVTAQFQDMQSRGISGVVVDWDGQPVLPNGTTSTSGEIIQNNAAIDNFRKLAEASDGKFTFAVSEDEGVAACIKGWVPCVAAPAALGTGMKASAEAQAISDINYIVNTWGHSEAYMKDSDGNPIVYVFGLDAYASGAGITLDWATIGSYLIGNPDLRFENNGSMTHALSEGSYAWNAAPNWAGYSLTSGDPFSFNYLASLYGQYASTMQKNSSFHATGSVYKGFDDGIVDGWNASTGSRYIDQQCGQTWLTTFAIANAAFTKKAPESIWLVTWDDYEEGTEMETGISNCLNNLDPSISGSVLSWKPTFGTSFDGVTGSENTVSSYEVFVSLDGSSLMQLADVPAPTHSYDLSKASLPAGTYKVYIEAVGKPMLSNYFTPASVSYTATSSTTPAH